MTEKEYSSWIMFNQLFGIDDYARIHRPAALLAAVVGGGKFQEMVEFLQPGRGGEAMNDADANTMRAMGFARKGG